MLLGTMKVYAGVRRPCCNVEAKRLLAIRVMASGMKTQREGLARHDRVVSFPVSSSCSESDPSNKPHTHSQCPSRLPKTHRSPAHPIRCIPTIRARIHRIFLQALPMSCRHDRTHPEFTHAKRLFQPVPMADFGIYRPGVRVARQELRRRHDGCFEGLEVSVLGHDQ